MPGALARPRRLCRVVAAQGRTSQAPGRRCTPPFHIADMVQVLKAVQVVIPAVQVLSAIQVAPALQAIQALAPGRSPAPSQGRVCSWVAVTRALMGRSSSNNR
jgi:hypothetical protein